jgi:ribosomal protein S18 acetylase RimI-like enzyme
MATIAPRGLNCWNASGRSGPWLHPWPFISLGQGLGRDQSQQGPPQARPSSESRWFHVVLVAFACGPVEPPFSTVKYQRRRIEETFPSRPVGRHCSARWMIMGGMNRTDQVDFVPATAEHEAFVGELSAEVFARFGDYETTLPGWLRLPWVRTVVATSVGKPIGFAMYVTQSEESRVTELLAIAVAPLSQLRGVGRKLLGHVERAAVQAHDSGVGSGVVLTVAVDNHAARYLLESSGYVVVPDSQGLYPTGLASLSMCKRLASDKC